MLHFNRLTVKCFRNWIPVNGTTAILTIQSSRHVCLENKRPLQTITPLFWSFSCDISRQPIKFIRASSTLNVKPAVKDNDDNDTKTLSDLKPAGKEFIDLNDDRLKMLHNTLDKDENRTKNDNVLFKSPVNNIVESDQKWKTIPELTVQSTLGHYGKLGKIKLTGLVVLTTLAGTFMATTGTMNYTLLSSVLAGTALTSCSAASFNHFLEVPFDSQMKRTQDRPLVQGLVTPLHAATFATVSGIAGVTLLATYVNPLTAALGAINLGLYSFIYTPMKRIHIVNTWIGAVVGAIPPVMGFTAVTGVIDFPSILLGLLLYSWQFPHFNALSWNMRHEYARAGYRMMSVTDPKLCQNTALRHSLFLVGITSAMCYSGMTHWSFGIDSLPFTLYLVYLSYQFRQEPNSKTSRKLFFYTLIYLPVVMFLMGISKNRPPKNATDNNADKSNNDIPSL